MSERGAADKSARDGFTTFSWLAALAVLTWLYAPHVAYMVQNWWQDPNYSHGFLVPLVSAWLIWRQRVQIKRDAAGPQPLGLVAVAAGLVLMLAGSYGHEFFLKRVSLIPVLWGLILLYWGWPIGKRTAFAVAYLILMVPLPYVIYDSVAFPLRLMAASLAGGVLQLMGIPSLVEGNVIQLPYITMNVVDACSGIRSLISLLAAGVILAYVMLPNRWVKVLVVLLVPPVAIFTNSLRVVAAGILAKYYGLEALNGTMHDWVGWLVFMTACGILFLLTWLVGLLVEPKKEAES